MLAPRLARRRRVGGRRVAVAAKQAEEGAAEEPGERRVAAGVGEAGGGDLEQPGAAEARGAKNYSNSQKFPADSRDRP